MAGDFSSVRRVLLKISGESLLGREKHGFDRDMCQKIAFSVKALHNAGKEVGIVVGGGNIFRGVDGSSFHMERAEADYAGMFATVINGMLLRQAISNEGVSCDLLSMIDCPPLIKRFTVPRALTSFAGGAAVIFVGGTGNPFFTTDTAAALKASELQVDLLLKATKVDGVYTKDPELFPDAEKYDRLSYTEVLTEKLRVMDLAAVTLCMENEIPIFVFNIFSEIGIVDMLSQPSYGTVVQGE